jgi:hypothetical protein
VFIHLVDLGTRCTPGLRAGTFQGALRLGVGELLKLEDLQFPILLDEGEDQGAIGGERSAMGGARGCGLHHG